MAPERGSLQHIEPNKSRKKHGKQRMEVGSGLKGLGQHRKHGGTQQQAGRKPDHAWQPVIRQALQQKCRYHDTQNAAQQGGQQYGGEQHRSAFYQSHVAVVGMPRLQPVQGAQQNGTRDEQPGTGGSLLDQGREIGHSILRKVLAHQR